MKIPFVNTALAVVIPGLIFFTACGSSSNNKSSTSSGSTSNGTGATPTPTPSPGVSETQVPAGSVEKVDCGSVEHNQEVEMEDLAFRPKSVTISPGQVVKWTNRDGTSHTVTSGIDPGASNAGSIADSGALSQGDSVCYRFNQAGKFTYFCRFHPTMMRDAVVQVTGAAGSVTGTTYLSY
jgi:plastocyanin